MEQMLIATYSFTEGSLVNKRREIAPGKVGLPKYTEFIEPVSKALSKALTLEDEAAEDELYELMRGN
jgi:hypothetical protein